MSIKKLKNISLLLFLCWAAPHYSFAQFYQVLGKVVDAATNEAIPFTTVYLNKTMIGTSTSIEGEFSLNFSQVNIDPAGVELIVSCIGYEPIIYPLDLTKLNRKYTFKLVPKEELLDELTVNGTRDERWYSNLEIFKEQFLGRSMFGQACEILNTDQLIITYFEEEGVLKVRAREMLKIRNNKLGYEIHYLLESFSYQYSNGLLQYAGYSFFKELDGGKGKQKKWLKNRRIAYNGSSLHFLRSLYTHRLEENGFTLRKLVRKINPERPSEAEMTEYRKTFNMSQYLSLEQNKENKDIAKRARLPRFIEYLDKNPVSYSHYLTKVKRGVLLSFSDFFQVVYAGEKEELGYVQATSPVFKVTRKPSFQTSIISLTVKATILNENGLPSNAFDIMYEGYWAWEKLGELLPLGYQPTL